VYLRPNGVETQHRRPLLDLNYILSDDEDREPSRHPHRRNLEFRPRDAWRSVSVARRTRRMHQLY
jgi:hypothetical protein